MDEKKRKNRIRGFQKERDLVRKLWDLGFATIRAPASGAKAKKTYQPDIIAIRNGHIFVIEVKTRRSSSAIYIDAFQVNKVLEWVKRAGENSIGLIAVYFDRKQGWRLIPIDKAIKTEGGNVKITQELAKGGLRLQDLKAITEKIIYRIDTFSEKK